MGNTWAKYWAIDEDALRDTLVDVPRRMSEERWRAIVERVCAGRERRALRERVRAAMATYDHDCGASIRAVQPERVAYERQLQSYYAPILRAEREHEEGLLISDDPESEEAVPIERGLRVVDHPIAARVIVEFAAGDGDDRRCHTYDVLGRHSCDSPIARATSGEARDAWERFLAALAGAANARLPWWAAAAYPSDHYVAVISAAEGAAVARELREKGVDALLAERSLSNVLAVVDFVRGASENGRVILGVESYC